MVNALEQVKLKLVINALLKLVKNLVQLMNKHVKLTQKIVYLIVY